MCLSLMTVYGLNGALWTAVKSGRLTKMHVVSEPETQIRKFKNVCGVKNIVY